MQECGCHAPNSKLTPAALFVVAQLNAKKSFTIFVGLPSIAFTFPFRRFVCVAVLLLLSCCCCCCLFCQQPSSTKKTTEDKTGSGRYELRLVLVIGAGNFYMSRVWDSHSVGLTKARQGTILDACQGNRPGRHFH